MRRQPKISVASNASITSEDETFSQRLCAAFVALEDRQPQAYQVPADIKSLGHLVNWSVSLAAARGDLDAFRGPTFSMAAGLMALARDSARGYTSLESDQREHPVAVDDEVVGAHLKIAMSAADRLSADQDSIEFLVDRLAGLRVEVFAREHPPPHFHVTCGGEFANYRIADCAKGADDAQSSATTSSAA